MKKINALAFIPARGGSKRLPHKNITKLNRKPLISHTIEAVLDSKRFSTVVVSTDDSKISRVASKYKGVTIDKRPSYLATDNATALNTLLEFMKRQELGKFDAVALLLPTCPLRTKKDLIKGFEKLTKKVDSVVSVTSYFFPYEMSLDGDKDGIVKPYFKNSPLVTGNTRSQDQKEYFHPNGAFYLAWWNSLIKNANFFKGKIAAHYMEPERSYDIDTKLDLLINELILRQKTK